MSDSGNIRLFSTPKTTKKEVKEAVKQKEEKEKRVNNENYLRGKSDNIIPPDYLTEEQIQLFNFIKSELEESKLLSNLDIFILAKCFLPNIEMELLSLFMGNLLN
jgi:phage terminase small subunit